MPNPLDEGMNFMLVVRLLQPVWVLCVVLLLIGSTAWAGPWSNTKHLAASNGVILSISNEGRVETTAAESGASVVLPTTGANATLFTSIQRLVSAQPPKSKYAFYAVDVEGRLFGISGQDSAVTPIGAGSGLKDIRLAAAGSGYLYAVTKRGQLMKIGLDNGVSSQLGDAQWSSARLMMAGSSLYVIDQQGTLYRVNKQTGAWIGVGQPGTWGTTLAATVVGDRIFSVDKGGVLWETNGMTGVYKRIKSPAFQTAETLFTDGQTVYIIYGGGLMERMRL